MKQNIEHWLQNMTIKWKLILVLIVVSIIPTLIIGIISLNISSTTMLDKVVQGSITRLELIDYRVSEIIDDKHLKTVLLAYNDLIRKYCGYTNPIDNTALDKDMDVIEDQVKWQLLNFYNNQNLSSLIFVRNNGSALIYKSREYSQIQKIDAVDLIPQDLNEFKLFDRWANATWEGNEPVIPYIRIVLDNETNEPTAYLIMNFKEDLFNSVYAEYELSKGTDYMIVNGGGVIQSCTDKNKFSRNISDVFGFDLDHFTGESGYFKDSEGVITYTYNKQRDLYFVGKTHIDQINQGFRPILTFTILIALFCVVFCVILGYLLSSSLIRPLYKLIERVSAFEESGKSVKRNEFAILDDRYSKIIEHLESSINEFYEEQKKKQRAEIRALEFQINPHFLYNTLSTIIWLIEKNEGKKAIKVTKELSTFFRISISKGKEFIALKEELRHVEFYINIQKARYEDKIFFECDVPEAMYDLNIPKLILQPLVENSIIHAMQASLDKTVEIKITAYYHNGDIMLEVRDNGEDVNEAKIREMNDFLRQRETPYKGKEYGIGISNVHDRVSMFFGEKYGLSYRRENNETVALIRIRGMNGEA